MIISIRPAEEADADTLLRLVKQIDEENSLAIREANESMGALDTVHLWLRELRRDPRQLVLLADMGTVAAGYLIARSPAYRRIQHTTQLMLGVMDRYQRQGVGTELLKAAEIWCKKHGIIRFELSAIEGADSAISLYKRNGFVEEGRKKKAFRMGGEYRDEIMMGKVLV